MSDFDYPPSREYTLGAALEQVGQRCEEAADRVAELEAADDADPDALQDARRKRADADNQRAALEWAVDQFGADATVQLSAFTARTRGRIQDTIRNSVMGELGSEEASVWFAAGAIDDAPWIDPSDDLQAKATTTGNLPPALVEWVGYELEDLNDLTEGN